MEHSQAHITHNNLPLTIGNKFRNQINQNTPPDVLNVNQQRYYHDIFDNFSTNTNYNKLKIGGIVGMGAGATAAASTAAAVSTTSSSSTVNSMPIAGVASIFGASISSNSAQGTSIANSSATVNANNESNLLNSTANNNNSNANQENR